MSGARHRVPELMDRPDLDPGEHRLALEALGRANAVSRTSASLWAAMRETSRTAGVARPFRVLDIACGGGHLARDLARRAARDGVAIEVVGCDVSALAVEHARGLASGAGARNVTFLRLDALRDPLPDGFDAACCSLFLHHLADDEAVALLQSMGLAARRVVLVSDLRRTRVGRLLAWTGCRLLSRSRVFHVDGPRSVDASFTTAEARALAIRAGLLHAVVSRVWPQRFLLRWSAP